MTSATQLPWLAGAPLDAPIAYVGGQPISRRRYLADVTEQARQLPPQGPMFAATNDRYRFAVALGAAALAGQASLLPPNHAPDMIDRLRAMFPKAYVLADADAPRLALPTQRFAASSHGEADDVPTLAGDTIVTHLLTSGTTGTPSRHDKRFDAMVDNVNSAAQRLASVLRRPNLQGVTFVGTVPPQHSYGFESSILTALLAGGAFASERPFFAADIAATLAQVPRPRVLVITPFHLKSLLDARIDVPAVDLVLSATAPLSPQLAARAEAALQAPLLEIYGCTEAGQVATRRTVDGDVWQTFGALRMTGQGDQAHVQGGHVREATRLADVLDVLTPQTFRLLGRSNDLINVAGKRGSMANLNFHLNSIEGVRDGAFWLPEAATVESVARLVAFVVAPGVSRDYLLGELRRRLDAVFVPRRLVMVESLPRDATGKLPSARLMALAQRTLAAQDAST